MAAEDPEKDARISEIFYYFEQYTTIETGRTVGRKIGVVQEFVLKKYLEADDDLRRRMYLERKLTGRSGASHKVEFSWYAIAPKQDLMAGDELIDGLVITGIDVGKGHITVLGGWDGKAVRLSRDLATTQPAKLRKFLQKRNVDVRITEMHPASVSVDIVNHMQLLASLESKRVGAQRFSDSDKLGSGIQTIEKAKQASLVAIDLDLAYNNNVKPLGATTDQKQLLSFVALGNGVHWTEKDKAVLGTYVDYTFLVHDAAIIRYAEYVRALVGDTLFIQGFSDYFAGMTKQKPDEFAVYDDDFGIIVPKAEDRPLRRVLSEHLTRVNPL